MTDQSQLEIREEPLSRFADHDQVSIAFEVSSVFDVDASDLQQPAPRLIERKIAPSYVKQYDVPGNRPEDWSRQFDVSNWGLLSAWRDGKRVGGAVVAFDTNGVDLLEGRDDLAVLWDLRVSPDSRRHGVASALFAAVEQWAAVRGCRELKVETQSINVPACRFYASRGCTLHRVVPDAYPQFPHEIMLIWRKEIARTVFPPA